MAFSPNKQNGTPASANEIDTEDCITAHIDAGSVVSHRYYLARLTVMEMLKDRGYTIPDSEITLSLADFRSEFGETPDLESLRIFVPLSSNPFKKIMVMFLGSDEIKIATVRHLYDQVKGTENLHRLIFVADAKMNFYARKELEKYPVKVEFFRVQDLLANVTRHVLQPAHEILTAEEISMLLKKYRLKERRALPHMKETDAIARYYGLEKGQVVKVSSKHDLFGPPVTYRCVV